MARFNVCGVLVHARPEQAEVVADALRGLPGAEVHATTEDGRLVVTVEDTPDQLAIDTVSALGDVPGVLSTSLVYHEFDDEDGDAPSASAEH